MVTRKSMLLLLPVAFAAVTAPAQAEEFKGGYVGVAAGYSTEELSGEDDAGIEAEFDQDSAHLQFFGGYDFAVSEDFRLGVEAALGIGADDAIELTDDTVTAEFNPEYTFEISARAGYLITENGLLYVRGGYQYTRFDLDVREVGKPDLLFEGDADGYLVGGGFEYALGKNLRSRVEYRYSELENGSTTTELGRHQILVGALWNF